MEAEGGVEAGEGVEGAALGVPIDGCGVVLEPEHDLGGAVPEGHNLVFGFKVCYSLDQESQRRFNHNDHLNFSKIWPGQYRLLQLFKSSSGRAYKKYGC